MSKKFKKASLETPLMKQYNRLKAKHPSALLLFRVGDFYETFGHDAIITSKILDIVLTKRSNGTASKVELAGFPYHALDTYLPKLVRAGQRVAVCDQLEDPKFSKGIVKRGITELVTPGLSFHDNVLDTKRNNYLTSLFFQKESVGIALLDVSTGEFLVAQGKINYIDKLMQSFDPAEVLFNKKQQKIYETNFSNRYNHFKLDDFIYTYDYAFEKLTNHFHTTGLKGFGIEGLKEGIIAAGSILHYLELTEHHQVKHIVAISRLEEDQYVWMDKFTIRNLELLHPQHQSGVSLIHILDNCTTPMGARMLRKWLVLPLKNKIIIEERFDIVEFLLKEEKIRENILNNLQQIGDIERLISKVSVNRINPRELLQLKKALQHTLPIKYKLMACQLETIKKLGDRLHTCQFLIDKIEKELLDKPAVSVNQGGIIKNGVNKQLDELREIVFSSKDYLNKIQEQEIKQTGINSLKIAYNKVFGYYLEVRNIHKNKVPSRWIRKQTLVNAERYVTEKLKEYEEKIVNAEGLIFELEQRIFSEMIQTTHDYILQIQQNASVLACLDCLLSFVYLAEEKNYCRPIITDEKSICITAGRHPVIEQQIPNGESYIPNDIFLDDKQQQIIIITGPNMAGKSALLRQTALIVLMSQIGCFVPAKSAKIALVDKIFTRVGASDNIARGESTFMIEMIETASILNNLSERSLVLMDEIGRGTSTYDGISIARAIVEYLHDHPTARAKTLFATHYHELNELMKDFPRIKNFNVSVKEIIGKVIFLRKLQEGGSKHSFGIHVAQMAGIPPAVVARANEIMTYLEKDKSKRNLVKFPKAKTMLNLFENDDNPYKRIKQILTQLDINTISPVEALLKLNEIKKLID